MRNSSCLVDDDVPFEILYASAERALETVSPITARHTVPPGRYYKLDRDLPPAVYEQIRKLAFVHDVGDLEGKLATATAWGVALLRELESAS